MCWRLSGAGSLSDGQLIGGNIVEAMQKNWQTVCQQINIKH